MILLGVFINYEQKVYVEIGCYPRSFKISKIFEIINEKLDYELNLNNMHLILENQKIKFT